MGNRKQITEAYKCSSKGLLNVTLFNLPLKAGLITNHTSEQQSLSQTIHQKTLKSED